jgi:tRNA(adenine34) deaminase
MVHTSNQQDISFLRRAIQLAEQAGLAGNLPIGAVMVLDGSIIAEGSNTIWKPVAAYTRHAEMEALRGVPPELWSRSREMTLYTTLEPCLMCAGAILLHQLSGLVYGSNDPWGGASASLGSLPEYFRDEFALIQWRGPALPAECDPLYVRIMELEQQREP